MSINHFSTDLQETHWWPSQNQQQPPMDMEPTQLNSSSKQQQFSSWPPHNPHHHHQPHNYNAFNFNLNQLDHNGQEEEVFDEQATVKHEPEPELDREPMFEKPLTPSDVGKLNRLVIPKQHAERYFPLGGGGGGGESGDKGLLLSFQDESGKCWRFRYSYWNSSQSYVLTKGWSRYVKEKRLDAGDIILFERHRTEGERLFIGWRRRGAMVAQDSYGGGGNGGGGSGGWRRGLYSASTNPYPGSHGVTVPHQQTDCLHAGSLAQNPVGNSKTLRLFGVNMECQLVDESEPSTPDGSSMSSQGQAHEQHQGYSSNRHNHMDITFSQDVNQMLRNRQG